MDPRMNARRNQLPGAKEGLQNLDVTPISEF